MAVRKRSYDEVPIYNAKVRDAMDRQDRRIVKLEAEVERLRETLDDVRALCESSVTGMVACSTLQAALDKDRYGT